MVKDPASRVDSQKPSSRKPLLKIVGIGASAGGLEAFTELLRNLPTSAPIAYVLVQHLDPTHRSLLSELLGRTASLPVQEITQNTQAAANHIYVIPPDRNLTILNRVLKLTPRRKSSGPARTIDHFLQSLAADQKENAIGVILSGAGSDGAKGIAAIKAAGGITFAQDHVSAKYDSMPRSAIATGFVDFVLPPEKIAAELGRLVDQPLQTKSRAAANARRRRASFAVGSTAFAGAAREPAAWPAAPEDLNLRKIFVLLRSRTGTDFSFYRPNTIRRRLARRMAMHKLKNLEAYARFLREHPAEVDALYQDLLINVTSFFRNPAVFEALKKRIFPKLIRPPTNVDTLRIWVAGCSTGQEAYSLAIAYAEFAEQHSVRTPIQIFATDVNHAVLDQARAGRYSKSHVENISPKRLQRYFTKESDGYRVQKNIRDMVIFAQHNLLTDPPFTRVDLISCRNMLIYLEPALQQRIIPAFHYALKPGGFLVLGSSESVGQFSNFFEAAEKNHKIYARKSGVSWLRYERPPTLPALKAGARTTPATRHAEFNSVDAFKEADRLTLAKYAPAGVLINEDGEILQFRGDVQRFLELPTGKASFNLLKMARENLALTLQRSLQRARRENKPVREKEVRFGRARSLVNIEIVPLKNLPTRCFLVLFEAVAAPPASAPRLASAASSSKISSSELRRFADLKRDYAEMREHLETLREQHDTSVEELQASNEEVQSANEELQSLNEELETSNEELESANEELTTLNEELATRNAELRESEQRLREQAQLLELAPVLARSPKDRIVFWNQGAENLYGHTKDDALGQNSHMLLAAHYHEPLEKIQAELHRHGRWEGEVLHRRKDGRTLVIATQWVAHHDTNGRLRAVLEVNADITARKQAEESLRASEEFNRRILETSPDSVKVLDLDGRLLFLNTSGLHLMELEDFSSVASAYWPGFWEGEGRSLAENACREARAGALSRFSAYRRSARGSDKWWDVVCRPILGPDGKPQKILVISRDVTVHKNAELTAAEDARLAALRADIASAVAASGELQAGLREIVEILVRKIAGSIARIWTFDETSSTLQLRSSAGLPLLSADAHATIALGGTRVGEIASSRRPSVRVRLAAEDLVDEPSWLKEQHIVSFAGYPLILENRLLGVFALFGRHALDPRELNELSRTAESIAHFISRKRSEEERARLYQEAVVARNEAVAASQAKDDFLAALSHELRTPLNPVLMLASDGAENPEFSEAVRAIFKTIATNVSLEARLIDDLLDLTRIAHGKLALEMKPIDLHGVLRDAIGVVAREIERKQISLTVKLLAPRAVVIGDTVRLQQVFWNVMSNAVKFTPEAGRIDVETALDSAHERILVRVSDNGIGLTETDLEKIFSAFSQGEHRLGGLGLGLAISRQLLEKHGGAIRASSPGPRQGATFEVELPLAVDIALPHKRERLPEPLPAVEGHGLTAAEHARQRFKRILLVEDHAPTRSSLQQLLARRKFEVVTAGSIAEAHERVRERTFQLVISDLGLPDGDGCQLWRELRAIQPDLLGIALSGYGMEEDLARSREAGFSEHLTKPVNIRSLDRAIAAVAQIRGR